MISAPHSLAGATLRPPLIACRCAECILPPGGNLRNRRLQLNRESFRLLGSKRPGASSTWRPARQFPDLFPCYGFCPVSVRSAQPVLAAGDDDCRTADHYPLHLLDRPLGPRVQPGRPADLLALADLDLLAEADPAVPGQVHR